MSIPQPVKAAQYLRMSTDQQKYSLANQSAAIAIYAEAHGYEIVRTYKDAGKSGVTTLGRDGLKALLSDVVGGTAEFSTILVLDVSRWGRFQDPDQGAHYEFICRDAGVAVRYCGEMFDDDGSIGSSILKHLKRVMAAEFSRELSSKVRFAQARGAERGFKQGGSIPYGFRRLLIGADGSLIAVLGPGEHKSLKQHRVRFAIGPDHEVKTVRRIFRWRVRDRLTFGEIARRLEAESRLGPSGRAWTETAVEGVLRNELVTGVYVHGRLRNVLGESRTIPGEPIRINVVKPIVSKAMFRAAAQVGCGYHMSRSDMLKALRKHIAERDGKISTITINTCAYLPSAATLISRFGKLSTLYALVGFTQEWRSRKETRPRKYRTEEEIVLALRSTFDRHGYISSTLISQTKELPSTAYLGHRYGGLMNIYRIAGLPCTRTELHVAAQARRTVRLSAKRLEAQRH